MRKFLLLIAAIALIMACMQSRHQERENIYVYFYYYPKCPWCKLVLPYIYDLKNNSDAIFIICNVADMKNCSKNAGEIAKKAKLRGVPTAVVANETSILKVFEGAYQITEIGKFLKQQGYEAKVYYKVGSLNYTVRDCINCHLVKGIPPPSHYSCSSCCHKG